MASTIDIFSLYKLTLTIGENEFVLIRTLQPSYSNAHQGQEDQAILIERKKRMFLLESFSSKYSEILNTEFIGELQLIPIGEKLYSDKGQFKLIIFYQSTEYGKPWIILGNANNLIDFENELNIDNDLRSLRPLGAIEQVEATLITENDFDLSGIENYSATDMRDL